MLMCAISPPAHVISGFQSSVYDTFIKYSTVASALPKTSCQCKGTKTYWQCENACKLVYSFRASGRPDHATPLSFSNKSFLKIPEKFSVAHCGHPPGLSRLYSWNDQVLLPLDLRLCTCDELDEI